jgi:predicted MPP superfamily phosphohydrolase
MRRVLGLLLLLLSAGELLLLQWAGLMAGGTGFSTGQGLAGLVVIGPLNVALFGMARRRIRATGIDLLLSRAWMLGSLGALLASALLAGVFLAIAGGGWLLDVEGSGGPALAWVGGAAVALGFGSVLWGSSLGQRRVRVDRVCLPLPDLPPAFEALRIAHVSDLHIGPLMRPPQLRDLVRQINALEPDLLLIAGDIFDFEPTVVEAGCRELAGLRARLGVYAVLGNHDLLAGADAVADGLGRLTEIRLLRDEWVRLEVDGAALALAGLEDPGEGWAKRDFESPALERLAREIPEDLPRLLLAHRPSFFAQAARLGFPLLLAGHTHGGQVALPLAPHHNPSRLMARWTRGHFELGESSLYVNRGLGVAGLPLRLNCPREIALIRLSCSESTSRRRPAAPLR